VTQTDKGQFVQFPIHLIYGCPDLNRDDKWVLLAIMGRCWSEGPQRLSYRDIAAISGVPLSLISSFKDKSGKAHEGIVDRLVRLNFLRIIIGKEVNPSTGSVKGQAQSYVYVNYAYIWQMNVAYCNSRKAVQEEFKVTENDFASVSHTNTSNTESVSYTNASVPIENTPVSNANASVSHTNKSVSSASTKPDTYITVDITDTIDKKDKGNGVVAIAPTTPSQSSSSEIDEETKKRPVTKVATNKNLQPPHPDKSQTNGTAFPVPKRTKPQSNIMDTLPSEEARRIMNDWDSIFSRPCTRTENHIKAAELLVPCHPTKDDLSDIRKFCYSSNPKWYRDKGVSLQDVAKNFDKWQSHQEAPKPEKEPSNEHKASNFYTLDALIERQNQWKTEGVTS